MSTRLMFVISIGLIGEITLTIWLGLGFWYLAGFVLGAIGLISNFAVMLANHNKMPVINMSRAHWKREKDHKHSRMSRNTRLAWLADRYEFFDPIFRGVRVMSLGDFFLRGGIILILIGLLIRIMDAIFKTHIGL